MKTKTIKFIVLVLFIISAGIGQVSARSLPPSTPIEMDEGGRTIIQNERIAAPVNLTASDGTSTNQISVTWNTVSGATYYQLYRHTIVNSSSSQLINSGGSMSYNDLTATAGTYYYYWVKACDPGGCSGFSSPDQGWRNFEAPNSVSATDGSYTDKVQVTWNAVTGITFYEIWRNTSNDSGSASKFPSNPTTNSFDDTSANPGIPYYYWVKACATAGCSAFSYEDLGYRAITPPTGVAATDGSFTDRVSVSWSSAAGAGFYDVWRSTTNSSGSASRISTAPSFSPFSDTTAIIGIQYFYWVKACSTSTGCSSFSLSDPGYRAILAPTGVAATDGTYTDKVQVSWNFVTGATYYEVRRFQSNNPGSAELIASPTTSPYNDTTAMPGIQYYYWIKGCSTPGCSAFSSFDTGYRAITAPTGVSATDGTYSDRVTISWSSSSGATSYQIWRNISEDAGTASLVGSPGTSPANDSSAVAGTLYYYWVKGCSATGCSAHSTSDSGYRALIPPTAVSATDGSYTDKISISWNTSSGATYYEVWHSATSNPATAAFLSSPSSGPYNDTTTTPGVLHYYWLKACGTAGCSGLSASDAGYRAITAPTGVIAMDGTHNDRVLISWSASTGATYYEVYRNLTDSSGSASLQGSPTTSPYSDTTATPGTLYYYWVRGCTTVGCSAFSTSDSGWRAINAPTGVSASDGDYTDIVKVIWSEATGATYYRILRNTSDTPVGATMTTGITTSPYGDTTAIAGTLYYYWAQGCNSLGCSPLSSSDSGYKAITAPTGVSASDGTYTDKVVISWNPSDGATFYHIWAIADELPYITLIAKPYTSPYEDLLPSPGMIYEYWVEGCITDIGCSGMSVSDTGYRANTAPTGVTASDGTYTDKVEIDWGHSEGSVSYEVWRHTSNVPGSASLIGSTGSNTYDDSTASPFLVYFYWVKSCGAIGCSAFSLSDSGYRGLEVPKGVAASDGTYTDKVVLSWNYSSGATYYQIWHNTTDNSGGATQIPGNYTANTFEHTTASPGLLYYYWIKGCNNEIGCSTFSSSDPGYAAIAAPTGVDASDGTYTDRVNVLWNTTTGAIDYQFWRSVMDDPGTASQIGTQAFSPPYQDETATPAVLYYYWVKGCSPTICSDFSDSDSGYRDIALDHKVFLPLIIR